MNKVKLFNNLTSISKFVKKVDLKMNLKLEKKFTASQFIYQIFYMNIPVHGEKN